MTPGFTALVGRRIDSRTDLQDGEEYTYCVHCRHMIAFKLQAPEAWETGSMPMCRDCMFTELDRVATEISEIEAARQKHLRRYRWWLRAGKALYWCGGVAFVIIGVLDVEAGMYGWATVQFALAAFYIWRFIKVWGWEDPR